jgi:hypothetical protein
MRGRDVSLPVYVGLSRVFCAAATYLAGSVSKTRLKSSFKVKVLTRNLSPVPFRTSPYVVGFFSAYPVAGGRAAAGGQRLEKTAGVAGSPSSPLRPDSSVPMP